MGKKYIIEIEDGKEGIILCQKGIVTVGLHLENESELKPLGIQSAIPYTEPDLEQVRKEAYAEGFKDGQYAERNGLTASYAQEQEEIKVGDEVVHHIPNDGLNPAYDEKAIALTSSNDTAFYVLYNDGCATEIDPEQVTKTGRHFPELATILEKMRGEQDG